jgi:DNA-binding IclR family transcriptional regulator
MTTLHDKPTGALLNRSVQRVVTLLKALAGQPDGMVLGELSTAAGLPESTTWRLLATLIDEGLVERATDGSGRYLMGLETFRLGSAVLKRLGIGQNVLADLEGLAADTGETVNLGALHGFHVLYLQKVESHQTLRASLTVGSATVPAHCSANGKMLLAHLPLSLLGELLDTNELAIHGPNTITDQVTLLEELSRIRELGYAVDDMEFGPDIRAVAGPIRDHTGAVIAAVAVAAPSTRVSLDNAHALAPAVMATAKRISEKLGYTSIVPAQPQSSIDTR